MSTEVFRNNRRGTVSVMVAAIVMILVTMLTGCSAGDKEEGSGGGGDSMFDAQADKSGGLREVAVDGSTVTIIDGSNPSTAPSLRFQLPTGWRVSDPTWDAVSPTVVKTILVNTDMVAKDETVPVGVMPPRIYIGIASIPDEVKLDAITMTDVAVVNNYKTVKRGESKLGTKKAVFETGTWDAPVGYTGQVIGTLSATIVKSGGSSWMVSMLAERPADLKPDQWNSDLTALTGGITFKLADANAAAPGN